MSRNVLILGASSAIARAIAHELARRGDNVILAARELEEVEKSAADLRVRYGVQAAGVRFDALQFAGHADFLRECDLKFAGGLEGVVLCQGYMAGQDQAEEDFESARRMIETNYVSAVSLGNLAGRQFKERGRGFICGISSVAGDRGRQSNFVYGSSKAAMTVYLSGLRNRLSRHGVAVLTVKPGFVDTAMTFGLPGLFLVATPAKVARDVVSAIEKGKDEIYTPWFWRGIMMMIRGIPERVFKRMKM